MPTTPDPKKILDDAMALEPNVRAFIAEALLDSLDFDTDYPVSQEWQVEIQRRCAEIDSGKAALLDGDTVIRELREKYT